MANKTREDIIAQLKEYVPQLDTSQHDVLVDNLIDLAAERISSRYNFSYLAISSPATHDIAADEYSVAEADFSFTNFKEALFIEWINESTGENAEIKWLPYRDFHKRYRYISFTTNETGKPVHYTRASQSFLLSCKLDEAVTMRVWYQKYHGNFSGDSTAHSFEPNNLGFQAIVCTVLQEVQAAIPGLQLNQKAMTAAQRAEYWTQELINADLVRANEPIEAEPAHTASRGSGVTSPYDWVS